jgi:hypothetical protein
MKPLAYLIFGPESSGTRMMTQYVILNANTFGDWTHYQSLDREQTFNYLNPTSNITWRRSLPHGMKWPDISGMIEFLKVKGYDPVTIGTVRSYQKTIDSQFRHGHIKTTKQGLKNYNRALNEVESYAQIIVQYDKFVTSKVARKEFLKKLGIKFPKVEPMEVKPREY